MNSTAAIACGGNMGDVARALADALQSLQDCQPIEVKAVSPLFRTQPVGSAAGTSYLNGVWIIRTNLDPFSLLDGLQRCEEQFGRIRSGRWTPRTIDLDLLAFEDRVLIEPRLTLPHPACWYRRFVLDPWETVAADWRHPVLGETVSQMKQRLSVRPLPVGIDSTEQNRMKQWPAGLLPAARRGEISIHHRPEELSACAVIFRPQDNVAVMPSACLPRTLMVPEGNEAAGFAEAVLTAALDTPALR